MSKSLPITKEAYRLFHDGTLALHLAEKQGFRIDTKYIKKTQKELTIKIDKLEKEFKTTKFYRHWQHTSKGTLNIYSDAQLRGFIYGVKKIPITKFTESGLGSTSEETLKLLNIPELNILIKAQKYKKLRDTFLEGFARETVEGYIHPSFGLAFPVTYRSSSFNPNFQNIPNRDFESQQICRKAIYPRKGHQLLEADYSGLEVSIGACYHQDPVMLEYLNNPASDMHADMAKEIFMLKKFNEDSKAHSTLRKAAKNGFVFPQFYGDYYKNNADSLAVGWCKLSKGKWKKGQGIKLDKGTISDHLIKNGIESYKAFENHIQKIEKHFWEDRFSKYKEWKEKAWKDYQKKGYVSLKTGFVCKGLMRCNEVTNYPVQGSAFHCLLWSFIELTEIMKREKWKTRIIGQIHDAIVLDVHPSELEHILKVIRCVTCNDLKQAWKWINVPLNVDAELCPVDGSWAEKEKIKM